MKSLRAWLLVVGVLAIQLGFIGSYVGAFHKPVPHNAPLAVVAPGPVAAEVVKGLDALAGHPVKAQAVANESEAVSLIDREVVDGAIVLGRNRDTVLVASGDGGALSEAITQVGQAFAAGRHQNVTVTDVRPANAGDARGLSAFYLVVGWGVGGYLLASLLAISMGTRPADRRRALERLAVLAVYSLGSGVGGALVVGSIGALPGHFLALAGLGTLLVLGVGALSMALDAIAGIYGIGLVIVLLVVLGNPSAGGAYPAPLLPAFWRDIGSWLPPGAGTTAVRTIVYFPAAGALHQLLVLSAYAVVGAAGLLLAARPAPALGPPELEVGR
jgi:hypothetical protein